MNRFELRDEGALSYAELAAKRAAEPAEEQGDLLSRHDLATCSDEIAQRFYDYRCSVAELRSSARASDHYYAAVSERLGGGES